MKLELTSFCIIKQYFYAYLHSFTWGYLLPTFTQVEFFDYTYNTGSS